MSFELQATQGSDNVFCDLGFPEAEAQNLLLRSDLAIHIRKVIDKLGITQAEARQARRHYTAAHERSGQKPHPQIHFGCTGRRGRQPRLFGQADVNLTVSQNVA